MSNFVSYANATSLMQAIAEKFSTLNSAYKFKGSIAFASLPATPARNQDGFVWNITDEFTTDSRFVEGQGKKYPAGTNVAVADLSTDAYSAVTPAGSENPHDQGWYEEVSTGVYALTEDTTVDSGKTYYEKTTTVNVKLDVLGAFVDVEGIYDAIADVSAAIAPEFDSATAYDEGDFVVYDGDLYKFTAAHAAGAWTGSDATQITVTEYFEAADAALKSYITSVAHMTAPEFDIATSYSAGDVVVKDGALYKFTADHAAGAWSTSDTTSITVISYVDAVEAALNTLVLAVAHSIAAEFNSASAYSVGDVVMKEGTLYKFTSAHTANTDWSSSEVTAITVIDYVNAINTALTGRVNNIVESIADEFDSSVSYSAGDVVVYNDKLYKFDSAHTGAWSGSDATAVTLESLVSEAEPDELTTAQVNTLIGLLD